jgi:hypothetical protein
MPIKERAKIFAPFDALKGFREMLADEEIIKEAKIEPSEDLIEYLSNVINSLEVGMLIEVKYYVLKEECYKKMTGIFTKIDRVYKKITVVKTKINIEDIIDIKVIENALSD